MNKTKIISILATVDAIGALSHGTLDGNIYMFDNKRLGGSTGIGTANLKTMVTFHENDFVEFIWNIVPFEPEVFVEIVDLVIDKEYVEIGKHVFEGSDITYWRGRVLKPFDRLVYQLFIKAGNREEVFMHTCELAGNVAKTK